MSVEFTKIISDFVRDILITFPEYRNIISKWWSLEPDAINDDDFVFKHCSKVFKDHFFNILNKNEEIMTDESFNTEFLPGIVFKYIWKCEISDATRETIWKYLQLILFSMVGELHNTTKSSANASDGENMFSGIDEAILKEKLAETFEQMKNMFDNPNVNPETTDESQQSQQPMPNVDEHIKNLMKGKLGKLALEFAEETAKELDLDIENAKDTNDAFQKMFKNPANLMNVVKNVGEKLDSKIKSGEIKESEIMAEGMELLNNMKNIPGMENMQSMFAAMGLGGGGQKMNQGATNSRLQQNLKMAQMRERMRKKQQENQTQTQQPTQPPIPTQQPSPILTETLDNVGISGENKKKKKKSKK
jgi:hypothetical protein